VGRTAHFRNRFIRGGSMGNNHDEVMLQILKDLVKGQNEVSQKQVEKARFQKQTLEVLTRLVSQ
jgi:hypothetical protein